MGDVAYVDLDDTVREVHGYAKQGAAFGYTKVKGLNVQLATISTPVAAAARLRTGSAVSARGASRLVGRALATARSCGADPKAGSLVTVLADSGFYGWKVVAAARRGGAPVLGHRADERQGQGRHLHYRRGRLDGDPLPARLRR